MSAGEVSGAAAVDARLRSLPMAVQDGIGRALARLSLELQAGAQDKVSGGVLMSRTGALRASIAASVSASQDSIGISVGSALPYAGFQEHGFHGVESVSAHLRTIKQVYGRPLRAGTERIAVRGYSRKVDYPAHSFLRAALADMEPQILRALDAAVAEAVAS